MRRVPLEEHGGRTHIRAVLSDTPRGRAREGNGQAGILSSSVDLCTQVLALSLAEGEAPVFVDAVRQDLGLRITPSKGPFDVLVIDSVEMPSEN